MIFQKRLYLKIDRLCPTSKCTGLITFQNLVLAFVRETSYVQYTYQSVKVLSRLIKMQKNYSTWMSRTWATKLCRLQKALGRGSLRLPVTTTNMSQVCTAMLYLQDSTDSLLARVYEMVEREMTFL